MRATLITGASMGIGEAFAREFARRGNSLVLVARSGERLAALAEELRSRKVEVLVCRQDLCRPDAPGRVHDFCLAHSISVDILVNCAGLSHASDFSAIPPEKAEELMSVNMLALARLSRLFAADMAADKKGGIINIASITGLQGVPGLGLYAATKAFVLSLTESMHEELKEHGVKVSAVCPGFIDTGFFQAAGHERTNEILPLSSPEVVVRAALKGLMKNRMRVYPTMLDTILAFSGRLVPRDTAVRLAGFLSGARAN
ncbi:MAG TPA: SDR family NAD(P)-dependent oxidoreductase [Chlorobium sp.]|uniref:Short-chain dehydrogenase/reductase SDR n=1 Tax=Chlorobium phaeovibrioides (strain DSM 265 / 1930) TaxID=290318 RepID=A4SGL3_CHLPM|nr:SDR family NAD(P)-dependent oxidoreductase [Chlorobium sp.]